MSVQQEILEQYFRVYGKQTLSAISANTGIQITRVFRILNGSTMTLPEYLIFRKLLEQKGDGGFVNLCEQLLRTISGEMLQELEGELRRKLYLAQLLKERQGDLKIAN